MMATGQGVDIAFSSLADLGRALAAGEATSVGIVECLLERIAAHDGTLRAFVEVFGDSALAAAREADERRKKGAVRGRLDGIPFGVKDLFDIAGHPTAAGSKAPSLKPAMRTATAVERLTAQGMIALGKTQTVEFAFGGWGTNPVCGTPVNPRDRTTRRVPGGSSSGSGVAVAAGLVPAALGTDTGGSVRNPSSMCGTVGLKTSRGLIGRGGLLPLATSFDTVGPLVRSVEDAALLLAALQGHDPDDPATFGVQPADPMAGLDKGLSGLRLLVPSSRDLQVVEPAVLRDFRAAVAELEVLGAVIEEKAMPRSPEAYMAHGGDIMAAEAWHNLRRYVDVPESVVDPAIRRRVFTGQRFDISAYLDLIGRRRLVQSEFDRYLDGADALLTPTAPITAPPVEGIDEGMTPLGTFTRFVNLMDMAALSVPIGLANGLPTALQIAVRRFDDPLALRIGRALEIHRGGLFTPPAGFE
jgi:aspartyl-tRNA(Asn)/glutamyl-tRNA(Gln) amidotransferase subunit A